VVPTSGRPRRGPGVQRPGAQTSGCLTSARQQGDRHRPGHLTSGRRPDGRRRRNHGRRTGQFGCCRRPGTRRMRNAQQAAAAGRHLRPGGRNGATALPRAGHHRGGQRYAGHRCAGDRPGDHRSADCRCAARRHGDRRHGRCRCAAGRRGTHPSADRCSGDHPHAGRRCGAGRRANHRYAGRPCGDWPHEGHQYAGHRTGNCPPAGYRLGPGREPGGRCSHRKSRATLPGRPGRCRCGTNLACSPVSHPTRCPGPGGCHSSCSRPDRHAGHRLGPGPSRCLNPGAAGRAHCCLICWHPIRRPQVHWLARSWTYWAAGKCCQRRCPECCCSRRHRTGPRLYRWRVPGRQPRRDPGQHRCRNGPDRGRHPPNGSGPAPRHHYGPGRPAPARLPRSCSTLS
jgi:hypothetical protein